MLWFSRQQRRGFNRDLPGPRPPHLRRHPIGWLSSPPLRYPVAYVLLILVSAMDISFTWIILTMLGGEETNPVALAVLTRKQMPGDAITQYDLPGLIIFKFCLMLLVIVICEVIGRKRDLLASRLSIFSVVLSAFPVAVAFWIFAEVGIIHREQYRDSTDYSIIELIDTFSPSP